MPTTTAKIRNSVTLIFLAGVHTLVDRGVGVSNIASFSMVGNSTTLPSLKSVITCYSRAGPILGFDFTNISNVAISSLLFTGCGHETKLTVLFLAYSVSLFSVKSCVFEDNKYTSSLFMRSTYGHISNSTFRNNTALFSGSALWINESTVELVGSNCFTDGFALSRCSVIDASKSVLIFNSSKGIPAYYSKQDSRCLHGLTSIVDNSVEPKFNQCCGGAVCVYGLSELRVYGMSVWDHNIMHPSIERFLDPPYWGGALYVDSSAVTFVGDHYFTNNFAGVGGAIYIRSTEIPYSNFSTLAHWKLENNSAYTGGAMYVVRTLYHAVGSTQYISNWCDQSVTSQGGSIFFSMSAAYYNGSVTVHNSSVYLGGMEFFQSVATFVGNATFTSNRGQIGAALYIGTSNVRFFGNAILENNFDTYHPIFVMYLSDVKFNGNFTLINNSIAGGCQLVRSNATINGVATIRRNTGFIGGGIRLIVSNLTLQGSIDFESNHAQNLGGAINAFNSTVTLSGDVNFTNNSSPRGGGMFLQAVSTLVFNPPLKMYSQHNMADEGAAIFVEDVITYNVCLPTTDLLFPYQDRPVYCFFYIDSSTSDTVSLLFANNMATTAGTTLYGGMLETCLQVQKIPSGTTALQEFKSISQTVQDEQDLTSPIASDPLQLCFCYKNKTDCNQLSTDVLYVRRGEPFQVPVIALGQANGSIPILVRAQFPSSYNQSFLGNTEDNQRSGKTCVELQYTVFSPQDSVEVTVYADGPCRDLGKSSRSIRINFLPCPIGFQLSFATCTCDPIIQPFTNSCNIVDGTIERSANARFWIGVVHENNNVTGLIVHPNCPLDYCINQQIFLNLNSSDAQCAFNRTGILCGECQSGLSLTLGMSLCRHCSNEYLALLPFFALAGVALIAFLLFLQLTVAVGTINGLVFYANVVAVNYVTFFPDRANAFSASGLFISWLNMDLGIDTCFYNGMNSYAKVGLQFIFPAYVWLLIGGVIVSSHYSSRASRLFGRNPVAVLSTLFLLLYTKLLRTINTVFSFTIIEYPDGRDEAVWLYDGNVRFLSNIHTLLFIVALLVLLFLFIPYTLYLTFGQCILARSKMRPFSWMSDRRLKPFLDAYHSPFSTEHRYWLGLLLLVRCALFLVTASNVSGNPSINLLAIITSLLGIFALRWMGGFVYRQKVLDALEMSFILNLGLLSVGTYHVLVTGGNQAVLVSLSVGTAFATFIGIIIYHIFRVLKSLSVVERFLMSCMHIKMLRTSLHRNAVPTLNLPDPPHGRNVPTTFIPSPAVSQVNFREPLLESCT